MTRISIVPRQTPSKPNQLDLLTRYLDVRTQTLELAAPLSPEDQMVQSMPEASPTKWHLAHTTWFFETFMLAPLVRNYVPFDASYNYLFNSYYKQLGGHPNRAIRGAFSRPGLDEILRYRNHVDDWVETLFERDVSADLLRLLELGMNHEQQHQELIITDIKHAFWKNPLWPNYQPTQIKSVSSVSQPLLWVAFDEGIRDVGHSGISFAFDNEMPRHGTHEGRRTSDRDTPSWQPLLHR